MKKIFFLTVFLFTVAFFSQTVKAQTEAQKVELCSKVAGGATLLESYPVPLAAAKDGERAPVFRQAVMMRKGNKYRFTICTDEESAGEGILKLFDEAKQMLSSYDEASGKTYQNIDFDCQKSAVYIIFINFKDGKGGSAVAVVSHVKTL